MFPRHSTFTVSQWHLVWRGQPRAVLCRNAKSQGMPTRSSPFSCPWRASLSLGHLFLLGSVWASQHSRSHSYYQLIGTCNLDETFLQSSWKRHSWKLRVLDWQSLTCSARFSISIFALSSHNCTMKRLSWAIANGSSVLNIFWFILHMLLQHCFRA